MVKNRNRNGPVSPKTGAKSESVKSFGSTETRRKEKLLILIAQPKIKRIKGVYSLFVDQDNLMDGNFANSISHHHVQLIVTE